MVGVPTIVEVRFLCWFMSLGRPLLEEFVPMRHQVDLRKIEVSIQLVRNISLVAKIIQPGVHFAPHFG
jgi:hypothetical protein